MREQINSFYEKNRSSFEIGAILLALSVLIINLQTPSGLAGNALRFVQFSLLLGSCIFSFTLFRDAIGHFAKPYLGETNIGRALPDLRTTPISEVARTLQFATKRTMVVVFIVFLSLLFPLSLLTYIVLVYKRQSLFIFVAAIAYWILTQILLLTEKILTIRNRLMRRILIIIFTFSLGFLALGIPFAAFILLISNSSFSWTTITEGVAFSVGSSLILYLIFIFTRKGQI